ncbi:glycosyl transferase family 1 [Clostridia bacterium]|nr:glycosyl transferase family 1 [Clostridia bacterium]
MNIGLFTDTYYSQVNGVITSMNMLRKELTEMGHEVFIFACGSGAENNPDDERIISFPSMSLSFLPNLRISLVYPPKHLIKIRSCKLDIVHTQTEFPMGILGKLVSEAARIPMVHTYHTMYEEYVHYVKGRMFTPQFAQTYSRVFCNRADIVIAPTEKTKASLLDYGVLRPIEVVPTGIDFSPFSPELAPENESDKLRESFNIPKDAPVVVFVGRLAREKSLDVTINAFAELNKIIPSAKMLIVGTGPAEDELKALCADLNIAPHVIFAGVKKWCEIGAYYRLGDVFMTSSVTETQGLTYIEAIASGTVVVAKKDRSVDGLIDHGKTGFLFENDRDAAQTLINAVSLSDKSAVAKAALNRISGFSSRKFAQSAEEIYNLAIENNNTLKRAHGRNIIR